GRLRLSATTKEGPLQVDPLTSAQRKLLAIAADQRTPAQARELFNVFRQRAPSFAAITKDIDSVFTNWPYAMTTLALTPRATPRLTRVFKRGDWQKQLDEVQAGVPAVLHPLPKDAPRNRLGFARWLVDRRSPTTARVIVNRVWQEYFGQGLFTTAEDIGTRVDPPSHPELLDWLACEFMEPRTGVEPLNRSTVKSDDGTTLQRFNASTLQPWSIKHIHRLIVNS